MGMSASQGRLLSITKRLSDVELSAQNLSNTKVRLAIDSEAISKKYVDDLSKRKLTVITSYNANNPISQDLTYDLITKMDTPLGEQRILKNAKGEVVLTAAMFNAFNSNKGNLDGFLKAAGCDMDDKAQKQYYTNIFQRASEKGAVAMDVNLNNPVALNNKFRSGALYMEKLNSESNKWESSCWQTDPSISDIRDDEDSDLVKAKYDTDMLKIQNKEKKIDIDMKNIDTEHSALQTEYDSVQKVINKNIETSFKMFS